MKIINKAQSLILLTVFFYQAHGMCTELWQIVQQKSFTRWANGYLDKKKALPIADPQPIEQKLCEKRDDMRVMGQWLRRIQWAQGLGLKIELQKQKKEPLPLRIKHDHKWIAQEEQEHAFINEIEQHKYDRKQRQQELRHQQKTKLPKSQRLPKAQRRMQVAHRKKW